MTENSDLQARDLRVSWHPYTQHGVEKEFLPVAKAQAATLTLEDGREVLDAISSWWAILHGHGEESLREALTHQMKTLDHVLFAGATHEPAVALAEQLLQVVPKGLERVFYSDDGSTAVEVALKMAYHCWVIRGEAQRTVFVALEGSYHGDTFGAMSVGDPDPFFRTFAPMMFEVRHVPVKEGAIAAALDELGDRACGVIVEPRVQGAAGMIMHSAEFLREARSACDRFGVPLIADEVMTGFGRTGKLFACDTAGISPDLLCLAKGLTGGVFPLSATLATKAIFETFLSEDRSSAFLHGHTFTAHPVGCAVALASLELCRKNDVPARLDAIGARIECALRDELKTLDNVHSLRRLGGIVAFDLDTGRGSAGYFSTLSPALRKRAIEQGVLIRPLGNIMYALPPACTTMDECDRIAEVMLDLARFARERLLV